MKLRITKRRIAVAVVLLPVLYVLNIGPLVYCSVRFGVPQRVLMTIYWPVITMMRGTALWPYYNVYVDWWEELAQ